MFNLAKETDLKALADRVTKLEAEREALYGMIKALKPVEAVKPTAEDAPEPTPKKKRTPKKEIPKPRFKTMEEFLKGLDVPYDPRVTVYSFMRNGWTIEVYRSKAYAPYGEQGSYHINVTGALLVDKRRRQTTAEYTVTGWRARLERRYSRANENREYVLAFYAESYDWVREATIL